MACIPANVLMSAVLENRQTTCRFGKSVFKSQPFGISRDPVYINRDLMLQMILYTLFSSFQELLYFP